jgi:hypothetical protein
MVLLQAHNLLFFTYKLYAYFLNYTYICVKVLCMTVKLNLTINEEVVKRTKKYAAKKNLSVSKIVEDYLDKISKDENEKSLNFVEKWGGVLTGKLSDKQIEKIKKEHFKTKYGI